MPSYHAWQPKNYVWQSKYQVLNLPISSRRGSSVTVFGALSRLLKKGFYFETARSTNTEDFKLFIARLLTKLNREAPRKQLDSRPWLVLDNHSAHKNPEHLVFLDKNFRLLFTPTGSSRCKCPVSTPDHACFAFSQLNRVCLEYNQVEIPQPRHRNGPQQVEHYY